MADIEIHIDDGRLRQVGWIRRTLARGAETLGFEYCAAWLADVDRFALEPALPLTRGAYHPKVGKLTFASLTDSAPDTWGRRLMQRARRREAEHEGRTLRALTEGDYLLGVTDCTRLGSLRFRRVGETAFQAPIASGVPALVNVGRLLDATARILRDEETDDDLRLIFAPGSSLGGARPKSSVLDHHGFLSIAKFPKETDAYSVETWEEVALRLARLAQIAIPTHELLQVAGKAVLLSRRFDRMGEARVPFLSALAMLGLQDGDRSSYPELADAIAQHGAAARADIWALYRRVVFNVMISNVDDHLRNHAFLRHGRRGWSLSPAYDLNPVPADIKARVLTTSIDLDEGTCSMDLLEGAAQYFNLSVKAARAIIKEVGAATSQWRDIARSVGVRPTEVSRMESAFEHRELRQALAL